MIYWPRVLSKEKICNNFLMIPSSVNVVVAGDGNCLFNAISMYFSGRNGIINILRLLTCIELFCFCDHYAGALDVIWDSMNDNEKFTNKLSFYINVVDFKSGDNIKSVKDLVKGLRYQAVDCLISINSESPFVCLFALCSIVSQKISCIYSQRNNVTHFNTYTRIIHPRELCSNPIPIAILWYPVGTAKPNYFVLCMDKSLISKVDSIGTKRKASSHLVHIPYKIKLLYEKVPTHNVITENLEHTSSILQDVSDPFPLIHTNPLSKCNPRIKSSIKNYFSKFEFPKNQSAERDEISVEDVSPTKVKSVSHQQTTQITFLNTDRSGDKCVLSSPSCSSVKNNSKQGKVCIKECCTNPRVRGQPVRLSVILLILV